LEAYKSVPDDVRARPIASIGHLFFSAFQNFRVEGVKSTNFSTYKKGIEHTSRHVAKPCGDRLTELGGLVAKKEKK